MFLNCVYSAMYMILGVAKGPGGSSADNVVLLRVSAMYGRARLLSNFTLSINAFSHTFAWKIQRCNLSRSRCSSEIRIEVWAKKCRKHFIIGHVAIGLAEAEFSDENDELRVHHLNVISSYDNSAGLAGLGIMVTLSIQSTLPQDSFMKSYTDRELPWVKYCSETEVSYLSDSEEDVYAEYRRKIEESQNQTELTLDEFENSPEFFYSIWDMNDSEKLFASLKALTDEVQQETSEYLIGNVMKTQNDNIKESTKSTTTVEESTASATTVNESVESDTTVQETSTHLTTDSTKNQNDQTIQEQVKAISRIITDTSENYRSKPTSSNKLNNSQISSDENSPSCYGTKVALAVDDIHEKIKIISRTIADCSDRYRSKPEELRESNKAPVMVNLPQTSFGSFSHKASCSFSLSEGSIMSDVNMASIKSELYELPCNCSTNSSDYNSGSCNIPFMQNNDGEELTIPNYPSSCKKQNRSAASTVNGQNKGNCNLADDLLERYIEQQNNMVLNKNYSMSEEISNNACETNDFMEEWLDIQLKQTENRISTNLEKVPLETILEEPSEGSTSRSSSDGCLHCPSCKATSQSNDSYLQMEISDENDSLDNDVTEDILKNIMEEFFGGEIGNFYLNKMQPNQEVSCSHDGIASISTNVHENNNPDIPNKTNASANVEQNKNLANVQTSDNTNAQENEDGSVKVYSGQILKILKTCPETPESRASYDLNKPISSGPKQIHICELGTKMNYISAILRKYYKERAVVREAKPNGNKDLAEEHLTQTIDKLLTTYFQFRRELLNLLQ